MRTAPVPAAVRAAFLAVIGLLLLTAGCARPRIVKVYAASSLTPVVEEAARQFTKAMGVRIETKFGGNVTLAEEIQSGSRPDLFLSADADVTDDLEARELLEPGTARVLAWNSLVAVVPSDKGPGPLNQYLLLDYGRIAVGDPVKTSMGRYTKQGLTTMGVWKALEGKLVYTPTARGALIMVEEGEADAGIVYGSDAIASSKVVTGFRISEGTHDVIAYTGAVVRGARNEEDARAFLEFLGGVTGKAIFREFGFLGN